MELLFDDEDNDDKGEDMLLVFGVLELKVLELDVLKSETVEELNEVIEEELDDEKYISGKGLSKIYTAVSDPD